MAQINGMHDSQILNNEIFGEQPRACELQKKIDAQLAQLYPEAKKSPKVQEALARIGSLSETLNSLSEGTREGLVSLYIDTVTEKHLSDCSAQVAILEAHHRDRVANLLGANDQIYSRAA
ncbi:MAG: hypothetical protein PHQ95_01970 [Candidatus Gracilibacteria bacterium]|nr:hypothetical protein [Candidatus Gracilibacteria bacterium]